MHILFLGFWKLQSCLKLMQKRSYQDWSKTGYLWSLLFKLIYVTILADLNVHSFELPMSLMELEMSHPIEISFSHFIQTSIDSIKVSLNIC